MTFNLVWQLKEYLYKEVKKNADFSKIENTVTNDNININTIEIEDERFEDDEFDLSDNSYTDEEIEEAENKLMNEWLTFLKETKKKKKGKISLNQKIKINNEIDEFLKNIEIAWEFWELYKGGFEELKDLF